MYPPANKIAISLEEEVLLLIPEVSADEAPVRFAFSSSLEFGY